MPALLEDPHGPEDHEEHPAHTVISNPTPAVSKPKDSVPSPYTPLAALNQWNKAFGVKSFIEDDAYGRKKTTELRLRLIWEEAREVSDEILDSINGEGNRAGLAKELADLLYVVYGTAAYFEIPIYQVFEAVHASNMSKLGRDGKPLLRPDGKILKGPNYFEADIESILG